MSVENDKVEIKSQLLYNVKNENKGGYYEKNNNNAIISSNFNNVYCWLLRLKKIQ